MSVSKTIIFEQIRLSELTTLNKETEIVHETCY